MKFSKSVEFPPKISDDILPSVLVLVTKEVIFIAMFGMRIHNNSNGQFVVEDSKTFVAQQTEGRDLKEVHRGKYKVKPIADQSAPWW